MCVSCECVTLNFVPSAPRAWTAAGMGPIRYHSASGPLAPEPSPVVYNQPLIFTKRASTRKYTFTLAYTRVNVLETKERMLIYLHAPRRLNRIFYLSKYNILIEYGLNNHVCSLSIIIFSNHIYQMFYWSLRYSLMYI